MHARFHRRYASPLSVAAAAALAVALPSAAGAQNTVQFIAECGRALEKDRLESWRTERQAYTWYMSINEQTYQQAKHNASLNVASKVPVIGDMFKSLTLSGSYSDFSERRRSFMEERGVTQDQLAQAYDLSLATSATAYGAWSECVRSTAGNRQAPAIWIEGEDEKTVQVQIRNFSVGSATMSSTLLGGRVIGAPAGKAFSDGTRLNPSQTRPLLIERVGDGPVKLLVATREGHLGMYVESNWKSQPEDEVVGTVAVSMPKADTLDRGIELGEAWDTPRLGNVRCNDVIRSGGGGTQVGNAGLRLIEMRNRSERGFCWNEWLGAERMIWVTAPAGHQLRRPSITCEGDANVCRNWTRTVRCELLTDHRTGFCVVQASSDPHRVRVVAQKYALQDVPIPAPIRAMGFDGQTMVLRLPKKAVQGSNVFDYRTPRGPNTLTLGESSRDSVLIFQNKVEGATETRYVYKINLAAGTPAPAVTPTTPASPAAPSRQR